MIGETLNLKARNSVSIFFKGDDPQECMKRYQDALTVILEEANNMVIEHHKAQDTIGQISGCKTREHLMDLKIPLVPETIFESMVHMLNEDDSLDDQERMYILAVAAPAILQQSQMWAQENMRQRAERIENQSRSKLIKL